jgi:hypothetical protein
LYVVSGVVVMEGYRVVFNQSSKTVGFAKSVCGPAVGLSGPYETKTGRVPFFVLLLCTVLYNIIANEELWRHAREKLVAVQMTLQLWKWIRHTLRKDSSAMEKQALSWILQGQCRSGRPRRSWRTIEEETEVMGKTWRGVKGTAGNRGCWRCSMEAQSGVTGN